MDLLQENLRLRPVSLEVRLHFLSGRHLGNFQGFLDLEDSRVLEVVVFKDSHSLVGDRPNFL